MKTKLLFLFSLIFWSVYAKKTNDPNKNLKEVRSYTLLTDSLIVNKNSQQSLSKSKSSFGLNNNNFLQFFLSKSSDPKDPTPSNSESNSVLSYLQVKENGTVDYLDGEVLKSQIGVQCFDPFKGVSGHTFGIEDVNLAYRSNIPVFNNDPKQYLIWHIGKQDNSSVVICNFESGLTRGQPIVVKSDFTGKVQLSHDFQLNIDIPRGRLVFRGFVNGAYQNLFDLNYQDPNNPNSGRLLRNFFTNNSQYTHYQIRMSKDGTLQFVAGTVSDQSVGVNEVYKDSSGNYLTEAFISLSRVFQPKLIIYSSSFETNPNLNRANVETNPPKLVFEASKPEGQRLQIKQGNTVLTKNVENPYYKFEKIFPNEILVNNYKEKGYALAHLINGDLGNSQSNETRTGVCGFATTPTGNEIRKISLDDTEFSKSKSNVENDPDNDPKGFFVSLSEDILKPSNSNESGNYVTGFSTNYNTENNELTGMFITRYKTDKSLDYINGVGYPLLAKSINSNSKVVLALNSGEKVLSNPKLRITERVADGVSYCGIGHEAEAKYRCNEEKMIWNSDSDYPTVPIDNRLSYDPNVVCGNVPNKDVDGEIKDAIIIDNEGSALYTENKSCKLQIRDGNITIYDLKRPASEDKAKCSPIIYQGLPSGFNGKLLSKISKKDDKYQFTYQNTNDASEGNGTWTFDEMCNFYKNDNPSKFSTQSYGDLSTRKTKYGYRMFSNDFPNQLVVEMKYNQYLQSLGNSGSNGNFQLTISEDRKKIQILEIYNNDCGCNRTRLYSQTVMLPDPTISKINSLRFEKIDLNPINPLGFLVKKDLFAYDEGGNRIGNSLGLNAENSTKGIILTNAVGKTTIRNADSFNKPRYSTLLGVFKREVLNFPSPHYNNAIFNESKGFNDLIYGNIQSPKHQTCVPEDRTGIIDVKPGTDPLIPPDPFQPGPSYVDGGVPFDYLLSEDKKCSLQLTQQYGLALFREGVDLPVFDTGDLGIIVRPEGNNVNEYSIMASKYGLTVARNNESSSRIFWRSKYNEFDITRPPFKVELYSREEVQRLYDNKLQSQTGSGYDFLFEYYKSLLANDTNNCVLAVRSRASQLIFIEEMGGKNFYQNGSIVVENPDDTDNDKVLNATDLCPNTFPELVDFVDTNGCTPDTDTDTVVDKQDACPNTTPGDDVDERGCHLDEDNDGVHDGPDFCPSTTAGAIVDANGCPIGDQDNDGVIDSLDVCPNTPAGKPVEPNGCDLFIKEQIDKNHSVYNSRNVNLAHDGLMSSDGKCKSTFNVGNSNSPGPGFEIFNYQNKENPLFSTPTRHFYLNSRGGVSNGVKMNYGKAGNVDGFFLYRNDVKDAVGCQSHVWDANVSRNGQAVAGNWTYAVLMSSDELRSITQFPYKVKDIYYSVFKKLIDNPGDTNDVWGYENTPPAEENPLIYLSQDEVNTLLNGTCPSGTIPSPTMGCIIGENQDPDGCVMFTLYAEKDKPRIVNWTEENKGEEVVPTLDSTCLNPSFTVAPSLNRSTEIVNPILIYPNPSTDGTISVSSKTLAISKVQILDLNAKLLYEQKVNIKQDEVLTINVTNYLPGLYIVNVFHPENQPISSQKVYINAK